MSEIQVMLRTVARDAGITQKELIRLLRKSLDMHPGDTYAQLKWVFLRAYDEPLRTQRMRKLRELAIEEGLING